LPSDHLGFRNHDKIVGVKLPGKTSRASAEGSM